VFESSSGRRWCGRRLTSTAPGVGAAVVEGLHPGGGGRPSEPPPGRLSAIDSRKGRRRQAPLSLHAVWSWRTVCRLLQKAASAIVGHLQGCRHRPVPIESPLPERHSQGIGQLRNKRNAKPCSTRASGSWHRHEGGGATQLVVAMAEATPWVFDHQHPACRRVRAAARRAETTRGAADAQNQG